MKNKIMMSLMAVLFLPLMSHAKYTCSLEVGVDDGVDLAPDGYEVMKDASGKELKNLPLVMGGEVTSDMFVAAFSPVSIATRDGKMLDGAVLSLGLKIPGAGVIAVSESKVIDADGGASVTLDLTSLAQVRDALGAKYQNCDGDKCHGNVALLSCSK